MYSKCWQIIRDDAKKTFEVCGLETNTNHFTNSVHAMQKAGMNVSGLTPPASGKASSKEVIKIVGYSREEGLHQRLLKEFAAITRKEFDAWGDDGI
jgi:hypothetical protein